MKYIHIPSIFDEIESFAIVFPPECKNVYDELEILTILENDCKYFTCTGYYLKMYDMLYRPYLVNENIKNRTLVITLSQVIRTIDVSYDRRIELTCMHDIKDLRCDIFGYTFGNDLERRITPKLEYINYLMPNPMKIYQKSNNRNIFEADITVSNKFMCYIHSVMFHLENDDDNAINAISYKIYIDDALWHEGLYSRVNYLYIVR